MTTAWPPVAALLYDLDGTLVDSMPLHHDAWRTWHARQGLPFDDDGFFSATAGRTNAEILAELFPGSDAAHIAALGEAKEALYREVALTQLQAVPGAIDMLHRAAARGLAQAVCTAAPPGNIAVAYQRFDLQRHVATTVSPDQGFRGKPHPDLFLEAARRLGVPPEACLVFEDAPLGIEAARRAGMRAVALTTTLPAAHFGGHPPPLAVAPDFTGLDLDALLPATPG